MSNTIKHPFVLLLMVLTLLASCNYDEHIDTYNVEVRLSQSVDDVAVKMTNGIGGTFEASTDADGIARFTLPAGIYSISASKVSDDEYFRQVCNGALSDVIIGSTNTSIELLVSVTTLQKANPILIKELYNGGCQKDDGSGKFAIDKCIILYKNS